MSAGAIVANENSFQSAYKKATVFQPPGARESTFDTNLLSPDVRITGTAVNARVASEIRTATGSDIPASGCQG